LWLAWLGRFLPGTMAAIPGREKLLTKTQGPLFEGRSPTVWRAFLHHTGRPRIKAVAHQAMWLHRLDLRPGLPEVRQPVLLLTGELDRVVPAVHAEVLLQGLPSAGQVVLAGCGHTPYYTHPELFAEVVRQFLTPERSALPTVAAR
jgi:pimeloyl-ACP methyl ester carboxylesterase